MNYGRKFFFGIALSLAILIIDVQLPLGIAGGVPYVVLVCLGVWFPRRRYVFYLAVAVTALTVSGYYLSSPGGILLVVLANRGMAIFAIWITAFLITYLKTAGASLAESEERYRHLADGSLQGIHVHHSLKTLYANKALAEMFGYKSVDEFMKAGSLKGALPPHEIDRIQAIADRRMIGESFSPHLEFQGVRADGSLGHFQAYSKFIPWRGKQVTQAAVIDVSKYKMMVDLLKESEARYKDASKIANLGHWIYDEVADKVIHCSDELARIHGVSPDIYMTKFNSTEKGIERVHPDDRENYGKTIRDAQRDAKPYNIEYRIIRPDNKVLHLREISEPIIDNTGTLIQSRGTIQDVTDRKKLEDQLNQSQRMEAIGQLTGGIAHDFNNLLAVMMGNLEFAHDKLQDDVSVRELIEKALEAIDSGSALTHQLLSFSRQQTLSFSVLEVNDLIADTISLLERTLGEDIAIYTKFDNENIFINIDRSMFSNALLNLALNARDAMPGGGTLSIYTSTIHFDGEQVGINQGTLYGPHIMIAVSDTGVGIDNQDLEKVMEPFFTTKGVGEGSGLGLSMVYGFIHQSKGHVGITSTKQEGTTVSLYLPIIKDGQAKEESKPSSYKAIIENKTILLVEDNPDVRETTSKTLRHFGYEVIEAEDGPSALDVLDKSSKRIDLVFSDVVMPNNMSGMELAERITTDYKDIKVLLTSGYPDMIAEKEDTQKFNIKLLAKPYRRAQLFTAIENTMRLN